MLSPEKHLQGNDWITTSYDLATSLRVWYAVDYEIEPGIATFDRVSAALDEGMRRVASDGIAFLFERDFQLSSRLAEAEE